MLMALVLKQTSRMSPEASAQFLLTALALVILQTRTQVLFFSLHCYAHQKTLHRSFITQQAKGSEKMGELF